MTIIASRLPRSFALAAALLAALALGGAWLSQYGFGLRPCHLCLYQRYPYLAIVVIGGLYALLARRRTVTRGLRTAMALLLAGLFLLDAGIAGYHVGVEQGWIAGPSACSGGLDATSVEALRAQILGAALVSCREAAFSFLGLSMAAWNLLYALAGAGLVAYLARQEISRHA